MRRLILIALVLVATLAALPATAQLRWQDVDARWHGSCRPSPGAITQERDHYIFRPGENHCSGSYRQRSELRSADLSLTEGAHWRLDLYVAMTSTSDQTFDLVQLHDGIGGCAPPLKLRWRGDGTLALDGAWTRDDGSCRINASLRNATYSGPTLRRDGTWHDVALILRMDGTGGFDVQVRVDGRRALSARYEPPPATGFLRSTTAFLKHGVYARYPFDFVLQSQAPRLTRAD